MSRIAALGLALALYATAVAALAQERIYRCGDSYSQAPCASGTAVDASDARSAAQVAQARAVAQRDARLADAMARARERSEQAAARQGPVLIGSPVRVAHDSACRPGSHCPRTGPRKHDQANRVTLYRAPDAR